MSRSCESVLVSHISSGVSIALLVRQLLRRPSGGAQFLPAMSRQKAGLAVVCNVYIVYIIIGVLLENK